VIDLLILLLKPALLWESNPRRFWYLTPIAVIAWLADMLAAHTAWALIAGSPKANEWTISHTLERLTLESAPDQMFYISLARKINRMAPGGRHIKAIV
jgi:hypothetical protein